MRAALPAWRRAGARAALILACLGSLGAVEAGSDAVDGDALCRRVFDAIDDPHITFGLQSDELRSSSFAALDRIVNFTRNCPRYDVVIIGHSDALGDEAFNIDISRRRAQAVADYLKRGGVSATRLRVEGRGSSEPVADNATRSGRAQNRRIEFELATPGAGR